jgi:hypothetical protein
MQALYSRVYKLHFTAKARCRRRTFHEPNLIDGLGTTEERRTNQLSIHGKIWSGKSSTQVRQNLSHYAGNFGRI